MNEQQKSESRDYLVAGGLLILGITALIAAMSGDNLYNAVSVSMPCAISGSILMIIGILLLVLQKRDLAGICFIITGAAHFMTVFNTEDTYMVLSLARAFVLIFGIVLLFSKDSQKWVFALISVLMGLFFIIRPYASAGSALGYILLASLIVTAVVAIYFALAAGFRRIHLPGSRMITADQTTEFKHAGSAIGYTLFGTVALCYGLMYFQLPFYQVSAGLIQGLSIGLGALLVLFGVLLAAIAKMQFTPVMFILMGTAEMLSSFAAGPMMIATGALIIITGLFAIFRTESRILPGIMLIIYGISYIFSAIMVGGATMPVISILVNIIPALIALYLAVATLSQRNMKLI